MEPSYFFSLILPLAILVVFLVGLVIYHARKEEDDYENEVKKLRQLLLSGKLDKKNFLNLRNRLKHEKVFTTESKKLLSLLSDEKIDENTYVRLRQVLEKSFRDRLDKLDVNTTEVYKKDPFDASKFWFIEKQNSHAATLLARVDYKLKIETHHSFKHKMLELKARVGDHEFLRKKLSALGAEHVGVFQQTDRYFKVPEGRLKLREVKDDSTAELIYYERENVAGPKRDDAFILRVQEPEELKKILNKILTLLIVIEKVREIYNYQGTQIHLDTVKKLGKFIEFERQTADDPKRIEKDRLILEKLMEKLEINPSNLETLSYSDLVQTWKEGNINEK